MTSRPQADALLRRARTPRWIGLAIVALVLIAGCGLLGQWQWSRTHNIIEAERAAVSAPIDVEAIDALGEPLPDAAIGRPVVARGRYLAEGQVVVLQRSLRDEAGVWVLTPLELSDGSVVGVADGRAVGTSVGACEGSVVGSVVGACEGSVVGSAVGNSVGETVGCAVGKTDGTAVGASVGAAVGAWVGSAVGRAVGAAVGAAVGPDVGALEY